MIIVLYVLGYVLLIGITTSIFLALFPNCERDNEELYCYAVIAGIFWPLSWAFALGCFVIGRLVFEVVNGCAKLAQRTFGKISRRLIKVCRWLRVIKPEGKI